MRPRPTSGLPTGLDEAWNAGILRNLAPILKAINTNLEPYVYGVMELREHSYGIMEFVLVWGQGSDPSGIAGEALAATERQDDAIAL